MGVSKIRSNKVLGALLGTIVEYYDYSLYGFSAVILAEKFFPSKDKLESLMYVFAIYALSYCAKPFGSLFFSRIGDKYGRKLSLKITILGISVPTFIIGILPDKSYIGIISTAILIICRFLQGFFAGGEYDGAAIYVIEHLGKENKYTASGFTRATGVLGLLLGISSANFFTSSLFPDWGWRVPFLLSLPLALLTLYYRRFLQETPDFIEQDKGDKSFLDTLEFIRNNWFTLILVIILAGGFGVTYQISVIFMKQYLPLVSPDAPRVISSFSAIIVFAFGVVMPIAGIIADKLGPIFVISISTIGIVTSSIAFMFSVRYGLLNMTLLSALLLAIFVAPFNALAHGCIIDIFKAKERYRGIGIGHATGSLLMSGTANYLCLLMIKKYNLLFFPIIYVMIFSIVTYIIMRHMLSERA